MKNLFTILLLLCFSAGAQTLEEQNAILKKRDDSMNRAINNVVRQLIRAVNKDSINDTKPEPARKKETVPALVHRTPPLDTLSLDKPTPFLRPVVPILVLPTFKRRRTPPVIIILIVLPAIILTMLLTKRHL